MQTAHATNRGCRYWLKLFLVGLVGLLVGLLLLVYVAFPILNAKGTAHPKRAPVCCKTPADLGFDYENVSFATGDGLTLKGWYIPSQNGANLIISHGLAGNRLPHLGQAAALAQHGYGVMLIDLRAHGDSDGDTVSFGGEDLLAAVAYLKGRPDVDPERIGALGASLGATVTVQAALRSEDIKAIVTDGLGPGRFQDMPHPESLVDWLWVPFDWVWFQVLEKEAVAAPVSIIDALPKISPRPLLLISGVGSAYERRAQQSYYATAAEPKTLWEVPGAQHMAAWHLRPDEYEERIVSFFGQALLHSE